jgi:hypothetical protein
MFALSTEHPQPCPSSEQQNDYHCAKAMTISNPYERHYYNHHCNDRASNFTSFGLITPPSEMRSIADNSQLSTEPGATVPTAPVNQRYYLRKSAHQAPSSAAPSSSFYPTPNSTAFHETYNSYVQARRGSGSSSTTTSSTARSVASSTFSLDSHDFNIGEFTAAVCASSDDILTNR